MFTKKKLQEFEPEKIKEVKERFVKDFSWRLKKMRQKANLTQEELADFLSAVGSTISRSEISKYENGTRDIHVSELPLISGCCNSPIYELFPKDESIAILEALNAAIKITAEKKAYANDKTMDATGSGKVLIARVYDINGRIVRESNSPKLSKKSFKEQCRDAEFSTGLLPYNDQEFCEFIMDQDFTDLESVVNAGAFLSSLEGISNKGTLKESVAKYIIDSLVLNNIKTNEMDVTKLRAYEYYRKLYSDYMREYDEDYMYSTIDSNDNNGNINNNYNKKNSDDHCE